MPADGMVLTVAEAPDSSLLGALGARVAACSLVCNAQGRAALRCSRFAVKELLLSADLSAQPPVMQWRTGSPRTQQTPPAGSTSSAT